MPRDQRTQIQLLTNTSLYKRKLPTALRRAQVPTVLSIINSFSDLPATTAFSTTLRYLLKSFHLLYSSFSTRWLSRISNKHLVTSVTKGIAPRTPTKQSEKLAGGCFLF